MTCCLMASNHYHIQCWLINHWDSQEYVWVFSGDSKNGIQKQLQCEWIRIVSREFTKCTQQTLSLRWCHNEHDGISNHQPRHCLLNRLFGCRSKKTSKLRVTGLCAGNSPGTGEFSAQMASKAENVSIWWRHHVTVKQSSMIQFRVYHSKVFMYIFSC